MRVGDGITGQGRIVHKDISRCGLHRMRVEMPDRYPDLNIWVLALGRQARPQLYHYTERETNGPMVFTLWLYWRE